MTEIPEDVMKLAGEVTSAMFDAAPDVWLPDSAEELIARAILAEREAQRERDAKIAEDRARNGFADLPETGDAYLQGSISSATIIAAAIRTPA